MTPEGPAAAVAEQLTTDELCDLVAGYALDKKARDVVVLDLRGVSGFTDAFVICSGTSDRQAKAIHDGIHLALKKEHGLLPRRVEGLAEARWILMDYLDVVVHIFTPETRDFYRLETLWGDVPRRTFADAPEDAAPAGEDAA
ncbi:MAG TPA: ribosome silencing factor [Solirubrobacteraceae bacterium]|nr:ribosome silencing factor [Solirubrobacteraceae bacterium]